MIEIIIQRTGNTFRPATEEDRIKGLTYPENKLLKARITGVRKIRSYRELSCYFGSCRYIADLNLNEDMNSVTKVDFLTRVQNGFVEAAIYDDKTKHVHWIPKRLNYETCNQPDSHRFIAAALESHAVLAGIDDVDKYVEFLRGLS